MASGEYTHDSLEDCLDSGEHLTQTDADGYCELCGHQDADEDNLYEPDDLMTDVEADTDVLRSAGYGTDEDYGYYGGDDYY